jgi:hypothetical protein
VKYEMSKTYSTYGIDESVNKIVVKKLKLSHFTPRRLFGGQEA